MPSKSLRHAIYACCISLASGAVIAADRLDDDDVEFIQHAAVGGMLEVELGQLAKDRAKHADVREFAQRMIDEHGKANDDLRALAQRKSIDLPGNLDQDARDMKAKLDQTRAEDFDEEYMEMMVDDHQKDVDMFEEQAKDAQDEDIRAFAAQTVPTLRSHRDAAKALDDHLDEDQSAANSAADTGPSP